MVQWFMIILAYDLAILKVRCLFDCGIAEIVLVLVLIE